jgi:hypothetical protein
VGSEETQDFYGMSFCANPRRARRGPRAARTAFSSPMQIWLLEVRQVADTEAARSVQRNPDGT